MYDDGRSADDDTYEEHWKAAEILMGSMTLDEKLTFIKENKALSDPGLQGHYFYHCLIPG